MSKTKRTASTALIGTPSPATGPLKRDSVDFKTPDPGDPTKKRRTVTASEHKLPKGAEIHLRPAIEMSETNTIEGVTISSLQRTPSPFGARMGDHTTAWQGHVDSVRARLHGKSIADATETLRQMQAEADEEMADPNSVGARLLDELAGDDADRRVPRLEDAAFRVNDFLDEADSATTPDKAAANLSLAVAQHLAYKNYLPFTTVPPKSERGSVGSGEGRYRNNLVDFEEQRRTAEKDMKQEEKQAEREKLAAGHPDALLLDDSLWSMFAFDAALRESHIQFALDPTLVTTVNDDFTSVQGLGDTLTKLMGKPSAATTPKELQGAKDEAGRIMKRPGQDDRIFRAASSLKDIAEQFHGLLLKAHTKTGQKQIGELSDAVPTEVDQARQARDAIKQRAEHAPERAALVLAHLLHEHQQTMAPAYPHAVIASGFLPIPDSETGTADITKAAETAIAQLESALREEYPGLFADDEPAKLTDVLEAIQNEYIGLPPIAVPLDSGWVEHAKKTDLVVSYDHGKVPAFTVNGRAPAPSGVAGMGCHTTAWAIEQQHPDALVHGAKDPADALGRLQAAVLKDVTSDVMKLDAALPFDQIQAGQLTAAYTAARQVLQARDVGTAATSYLTFRNLLPYATVDAGDRGGHSEKKDGDQKSTFDAEALRVTAALKDTELKTAAKDDARLAQQKQALLDDALKAEGEGRQDDADRLREQADRIPVASERLRAAADDLKELADDVTSAAPDGDAGKPYETLSKAIKASARRLEAMAAEVQSGKAAAPAANVVSTRTTEHGKVWREVQAFRVHLPAK
ncbi:hypothetical protein J5X84_31375 [Streptosporangiaceae bacterium NEAU-GS5]|nr:hypothetical protein [Streptosporangiaceae bacterium NEAU-GS5]